MCTALPECCFSMPAPESHRSVVLLIPHGGKSSQNHIPFGRSFSCNRLLGNKKSRHINAHRLGKRVDYPPFCEGWFHINVTGFEIQSRNCLLRLTSADSSGRIRKRRYFLLAYRRHWVALLHLNLTSYSIVNPHLKGLYFTVRNVCLSMLF